MTARAQVAAACKMSGTHSHTLGDFMKQTHMKVHKNHHMSFAPVCHLHQHCEDHPDINSAFAPFVTEALKSNSANPEALLADGNKKKGGRKKDLDELKDTMKDSADKINNTLKEGNADRKKLINAYAKELEHEQWDMQERKWNSLSSLAYKFEELFEKNLESAALCPLASRIQVLENELCVDGASMFHDDTFEQFKVTAAEPEEQKMEAQPQMNHF